jgi:peptidyl-prolyl cis-trans isomerase D
MSMLQIIRERAQGIMAWVLLIVVGVPFILWGIQNYIDTGREKPAAVVGDREIFDRDVTRAYEKMVAEYGDSQDFDEKALRHEALEQVIRDEVISQTADQMHLASADEEARELIQTLPYFQVAGKFDKEKYRTALASQGMTAEQFVARIKSGLVAQQLEHAVLESAFTTPLEVATLLRLKNQERRVDYVKVPLKPASRNFTDAEIKAYFDAHVAEFRNPEKVAVDYLELTLDDLAKKVTVSDDDIKRLYEEQKGNYGSPERRKISHILIVAEGEGADADAAALAKAQTVRERIVKGADYAQVAKEVSQDPVSAKTGGDLGFLNKEAQEPVFTEAASHLKTGEISAPVKTSFGYHLIKVTELVPASYRPLEAVRDELKKMAQKNNAETAFYERGQKLAELTFEHPDSLEEAASALGLKVRQTAMFTATQGEGLAAEGNVRKAAFSEDVLAGKNSEPVELGEERAVVLRIRDHEPASDKSIDSVRATIVDRLKDQQARDDAAKASRDLLTAVQQGKGLQDAAKPLGLTVTQGLALLRTSEKVPLELLKAVFTNARPTEGKPTPGEVALVDGSHYVFVLTQVKDGASIAKDPKEFESASEFMERGYAQLEYTTFIERLRERMDVEINKKD